VTLLTAATLTPSGVLDCSALSLTSQINAATLGAPSGTKVLFARHGAAAELGVDETLALRPGLVYDGHGGIGRQTRLLATPGFPAGQPLLAAQGYLLNRPFADNPITVRGIDIDAAGKAGSDGLVVFNFWSTFEDIQINNVAGTGALSSAAGLRITDRGINGTTISSNSHSENKFHDIRVNSLTAGASAIVQSSFNSNSNQDGHLIGCWLAGINGRGLEFARGAGWTMRDVHMYGVGDDGARILACYATHLDGFYIEGFGGTDTAADNYHGLQMEFLSERGSKLNNLTISSNQPDSPAATRFTNLHLRAGVGQTRAMVTVSNTNLNLPRAAAPTVAKSQALRLGESGDTGRMLYVDLTGVQVDPLAGGWMSPSRFVHAATVTVNDNPVAGARAQAFSATPTIDPGVSGSSVDITATADITALNIATSSAANRQKLTVAVLASGAIRNVTVAAAVRTSGSVTRGPYAVPAGEVLLATFEFSGLVSSWVLTDARMSAA
jgi:hypothetical protein